MQLNYGLLAWIVLVMERWWSALGASENHDALTFKKSAPPSIQNHTAPLRSHTLVYSDWKGEAGTGDHSAIIPHIFSSEKSLKLCSGLEQSRTNYVKGQEAKNSSV